MKVTVTREHIAKGVMRCGCNCPVALAIKDAVGHDDVEVSNHGVKIGDGRAYLPLGATAFIANFDSGHPNVAPFEFEI